MDIYATVILAAGKGTRMRSTLPKVLHPLAGVPLLQHVLSAIEAIPSVSTFASLKQSLSPHPSKRPILVVGHEAAQVEAVFGSRCQYAIQQDLSGTGTALLSARETVDELNPLPQMVLVCNGDTPFVGSELLASVLVEHVQRKATITFLTALADESSDFGRIVRGPTGQVQEIVEVKRATEEQKRIDEVNSGVYCFDRDWLWPNLQQLPRNEAGEYYLTDLIGVAARQGRNITTVRGTIEEGIGINDRVQLAAAEQVIRRRILEQHMYAGVTIVDPATTYIDAPVQIDIDTVILPGTMITGATKIGAGCRIGPYTTIHQSRIGDNCVIRQSALEEAILEEGVSMGPFSHCRPGAHLARNVHMGNYAEVKNSYVGAETDMHHFSYLGDATVGEHVNVGAGTITCNFDGLRKNHTDIGDHAFIGSDTMLVAPVSLGEHAQTGAGSVVLKDVPPWTRVAGVPARELRVLQPDEEDKKKE
jgi:bifunctional UDP-N-acetylglucosamine pyrophosphorylase/glucosamine-1-phosphate N-acetyltransferase